MLTAHFGDAGSEIGLLANESGPTKGPADAFSKLPLDAAGTVERFLSSWPHPRNFQVLALAKSLRQPIGYLFEGSRFLDQIAWASLGYYRPGDRFQLTQAWYLTTYDNPASLALMLRAWAKQAMPRLGTYQFPQTTWTPSIQTAEALFWWERLKQARLDGVEPIPPPGKPVSAIDDGAPMPTRARLSTPALFGVVAVFVAAGLGAAALIRRR